MPKHRPSAATAAAAVSEHSKGEEILKDSSTVHPSLSFTVVAGSYDRKLVAIDAVVDDAGAVSCSAPIAYVGHDGSIRAVATSGSLVATASTDETVKVYDFDRRTVVGTLFDHVGAVNALAIFSATSPPSGAGGEPQQHPLRWLVSGGDDGRLLLWRGSAPGPTAAEWGTGGAAAALVPPKHKGGPAAASVSSVAVHPSGRLLLSVTAGGTLRLWNLLTALSPYATRFKTAGEPPLVVFSPGPSGSLYVVACGCRFTVHATLTGATLQDGTLPRRITAAAYAAETHLMLGTDDGRVHVFRSPPLPATHAAADVKLPAEATAAAAAAVTPPPPLVTLEAHSSRIKGLATIAAPSAAGGLPPPLLLVASAASDGVVKLWRLRGLLCADAAPKPTIELAASVDTRLRLTCLSIVAFSGPAAPAAPVNSTDRSVDDSNEQQQSAVATAPKRQKPAADNKPQPVSSEQRRRPAKKPKTKPAENDAGT